MTLRTVTYLTSGDRERKFFLQSFPVWNQYRVSFGKEIGESNGTIRWTILILHTFR